MSEKLDKLKRQVAELEAEELLERKQRLLDMLDIDNMSRSDMIILRDMLSAEITRTYDCDDE